DADVARENLGVVIRAARIDAEPVRQLSGGFVLIVHSSASISFFNACGVVVGACRATTLPLRSTRNLVKFHLIDGPSMPDFSLFRYWYSGCTRKPLTSILANIGKVTA